MAESAATGASGRASSHGSAHAVAVVVLTMLLVLVDAALGAAGATSTTSGTAARAAKPSITVATYNVLTARSGVAWKPRRAAVAAAIRRTGADLVVLQEAEGRGDWYEVPVDRARARRLPALWLARKTGMVLAPTNGSSDPRVGLYVARKGQHILYDPTRLRQLTGPCDQRQITDTGWATFADRRTGRTVRLVGLHLNRGATADGAGARSQALARQDLGLSRCARHGLLRRAATIWAGDFNTSGDRALIAGMRGRGLVDSVKVARRRSDHRVDTFNGRRREVRRTGRRIDQIWVPRDMVVRRWSQVVSIRSGRYVGRFGSDHNPVVAEVVL